MKYIEVKTIFEKKDEALNLANLLLSKKLVACVQIGEIQSLYHWKGKLENEKEYVLTMKTKETLYEEIEKTIKANHSYEVAEIVALPILKGSKEYLSWIDETTK